MRAYLPSFSYPLALNSSMSPVVVGPRQSMPDDSSSVRYSSTAKNRILSARASLGSLFGAAAGLAISNITYAADQVRSVVNTDLLANGVPLFDRGVAFFLNHGQVSELGFLVGIFASVDIMANLLHYRSKSEQKLLVGSDIDSSSEVIDPDEVELENDVDVDVDVDAVLVTDHVDETALLGEVVGQGIFDEYQLLEEYDQIDLNVNGVGNLEFGVEAIAIEPQDRTTTPFDENTISEPTEEIIEPAVETPQSQNRVICGYEILSLIGDGVQGEVYRARRVEDGVEVAFKVIRRHRYEFDQFALFLKRGIDSPHLAKVLDFDFKSEYPFVVMELLPGPNLSTHMNELMNLNPIDPFGSYYLYTLNVALGVASGLATMHENGVVHRDVKTSNVVFRDFDRDKAVRTGDVTPVLVDYGLAAKVGTSALFNFSGTVTYMAPELFVPERFDQNSNRLISPKIDPKQDIYSFGVLLYKMVTFAFPYPEMESVKDLHPQSCLEIYQFYKTQPRINPRDVNPAFDVGNSLVNPKTVNSTLPDELARIIVKCLQIDPNDRYQSMKEVIAELKEYAKICGLPS